MTKTSFVAGPTCLSICFLALVGLSIGLLPARAATAKGVPLSPTTADPSNTFLAVQVASNGQFNMGANPGATDCATVAPFTTPCQYNLMYDWPDSPGTSFTVIEIDGQYTEYDQGVFVSPPTDSVDGLENSATADFTAPTGGTVQVVQDLTIVQGVSGNPDTCRIRYIVTNNDSQPHNIGVAVMLDTMLNNYDGAPFLVNGDQVTNETDYIGAAVPAAYDVFYDFDVPGISAHGTLVGAGATTPDRFVIAAWPDIVGTSLFDFTADPTQLITSDSADAVYWNPTSVGPGESRVLITYYGVSSGVGSSSLVVVAPQSLSTVPGSTPGSVTWSPNPFPVEIFFSNSSTDTVNVCPNIVVAPADIGLITPAANNCPEQLITVLPGASIQTQLMVTAVQAGTAQYLVEMLQGDDSVIASQEVETTLPELIVPPVQNPLNPGTIPLHADGVFCADTSVPCTNSFGDLSGDNNGGVPTRPFEWDGITPLAFITGAGNATPALLNDSNVDVYVYSAVDSSSDGTLSFFLMYDFPQRTTPFGSNDLPTVTFDVASGRFQGTMVVTLDCVAGTLSVDGFDFGVPFTGRSGSDLGLVGGCGFGKSPNPSGDATIDSLLNTEHAMFELQVPLTENLGGSPNTNGVYSPLPAAWSASAPVVLSTNNAVRSSAGSQLVLSDNMISINITNGATTATPTNTAFTAETPPTFTTNDLAIVKLTATPTVRLGAGASVTKRVTVEIQNRNPHSITVSNLTMLANLVSVTLESDNTNSTCVVPTATLVNGAPNKVPRTIKSKGTLNVVFNVSYSGCANILSYIAQLDPAALGGGPYIPLADGDCPRAPLPSGVDNALGLKIKDTGCDSKYVVSGVQTHVVVK